MLISIYKTSGHSMSPEIEDSTFFIGSSIPIKIFKLKKGDKIIFKDGNSNIVKKISKIENENIFIEGINKLDSKKFDPIKKEDVIGKVIWIL